MNASAMECDFKLHGFKCTLKLVQFCKLRAFSEHIWDQADAEVSISEFVLTTIDSSYHSLSLSRFQSRPLLSSLFVAIWTGT
jgi:hypothetical protein